MSMKLLMSPSEVIDYAFATGEYVALGAIPGNAILAAQQRYIIPVLGKKLAEAVAQGDYEELREEYIAPTLGILARIEASLSAYPPTKAERQRAKLFLTALSDYLNANASEFAEYDPEENVMNRCSLVGGYVF
ncbi:MAG: hypothetical protein SNG49_04430 [Rikenellaceae bacterium]